MRVRASLFERLAGDSLASAILGDLEEERARRRQRSSPAAATLWFALASVSVLADLIAGRAADLVAILDPRRALRSGRSEWRHAVRSLLRQPWYTATLISVIAMTTTLGTTVFAVVDGVLFKPLPYPRADELSVVVPGHRGLSTHVGHSLASAQDLVAWRAAVPGVRFAGVRLPSTSTFDRLQLGAEVNSPQAAVASVDADFLRVLGAHPVLGGFVPRHFEYEGPVAPHAVLLTYRLWQAAFAADPGVIGRRITVRESPRFAIEIVGVLPSTFVFPGPVDAQALMAYAPEPSAATNPRRRTFDEVIARIPAGTSPELVRQEIEQAMLTTAARFPAPPPGGWAVSDSVRFSSPFDEATVSSLWAYVNQRQAPMAVAVFVAATLILLLGAVNVSSLIVARGHQRVREVQLRRALGADGWALVHVVFAEVAVVTVAGVATGLALAGPVLPTTLALLPGTFHPLKSVAIDWRVAGFAALLSLVSAVVMTIAPAWQALRSEGAPGLGGAVTSTPRLAHGGRFVIGIQVAIATALVIGGTLLVGSLIQVWQQSAGFDPRVTTIALQSSREPQAGGAADIATLLERVRAVPGVERAAVTDANMLNGALWGSRMRLPAGIAVGQLEDMSDDHGVTSDYFDVMRLKLVDGRYPTAAELDNGTAVVVSESLARGYWPGVRAVGQTLSTSRTTFQVVGVVANARYNAWDRPSVVIYGSYAKLGLSNLPSLLVRGRDGSDPPVTDVLRVVDSLAPAVRALRVNRLDELLSDSIRPRRFDAWLFGAFAAGALLIVSTGLFGLMSMTAARRTREVGVRIALGSTPDRIVRLMLGEQAIAVGAGLVAGGVVAAWAAQFLKSHMYQFTVYDWRLWSIAAATLLITACLGTLAPAIRASRVDPVRALRAE